MKILYFHSTWGLEALPRLADQLAKIKAGGFDGVELAVPEDGRACREARAMLDDIGLEVIAQQWRTSGNTVAEHLKVFDEHYERALLLRPLYLNSHTGRDHFPVAHNLQIFDHIAGLTRRHGLEVYHETHRSRALFSAPATQHYLAERPDLKLVADFSHWCCVHESLLADQPERVDLAIRHAYAIHARVGHSQGPQVPDPRDPLWRENLETHLGWWKQIVTTRRVEGREVITITPEFGPAPYTTLRPMTHEPIADVWEINHHMRGWLVEQLAGC